MRIYDKALEYFFISLKIREKVLGFEHLETAKVNIRLIFIEVKKKSVLSKSIYLLFSFMIMCQEWGDKS